MPRPGPKLPTVTQRSRFLTGRVKTASILLLHKTVTQDSILWLKEEKEKKRKKRREAG